MDFPRPPVQSVQPCTGWYTSKTTTKQWISRAAQRPGSTFRVPLSGLTLPRNDAEHRARLDLLPEPIHLGPWTGDRRTDRGRRRPSRYPAAVRRLLDRLIRRRLHAHARDRAARSPTPRAVDPPKARPGVHRRTTARRKRTRAPRGRSGTPRLG
ncbi:hypothetical protein DXT68_12395 [Microbacterium foliorum]|nr:hypothetical protein DXT68_12395 [Microbacterium foliorum]